MIQLENYSAYVKYNCNNIECAHLAIQDFNYTFNKGIYFLVGEIDSGNTALAYSFVSKKKNIFDDSKIYIDNVDSQEKDLKNISAYLYNRDSFIKHKTCKKALSRSEIPENNIKEILHQTNFPEWLLDRSVSLTGRYSELFWAIYYYFSEKRIIVLPWKSKSNTILCILNSIISLYEKKDCLLIIPMSKELYESQNFVGTEIVF